MDYQILRRVEETSPEVGALKIVLEHDRIALVELLDLFEDAGKAEVKSGQ